MWLQLIANNGCIVVLYYEEPANNLRMTDVSLTTLTFALYPTKVTRPALCVHKTCFAGMSSRCTIIVYALANGDVKKVWSI